MDDLEIAEMTLGRFCVVPTNSDRIVDDEGKLMYGTILFRSPNKDACDRYIKRCALNKLIYENPDLEVIPMVEYEVCCGDDYNRWAGSIGESKIREYFFDDSNEGELRYKDWYTPEGLKEIEERGIKWNKAIFLFIDLPEIIT